MKRITTALLLAFCLLGWGKVHRVDGLSRLAAEGSRSEGKATVYFLRDGSGALGVWSLGVKVDKSPVGSVRRKTYVRFDVAPGEHDLMASWPLLSGGVDLAIKADFEPDRTYYFVFGSDMESGQAYRFISNLSQIDQDAAAPLLSEYKEQTAAE